MILQKFNQSIRVGKKHALTGPSQSKHTKKYLNNSARTLMKLTVETSIQHSTLGILSFLGTPICAT